MDPPLSYLSKGNLQGWQQWVGNSGITPVHTDSDANTAAGVTSVSSKLQSFLAHSVFGLLPFFPVSSVTLPGTSCNFPSTCPNQRKLRTQGRGRSPWIWGTSSPPTRGWGKVIEKEVKANAEADGQKWRVPLKQVLWMWQKWFTSPISHRAPVSGHPGLWSKILPDTGLLPLNCLTKWVTKLQVCLLSMVRVLCANS